MHVDIGGGHEKVCDHKGHADLSLYSEYCNLTLLWMIDQVKDFLVFRPEGIRTLQAQMLARARIVNPAATGVDWATTNLTNSYKITQLTSWAGSAVRIPGDYAGLKRKWTGMLGKLPMPLPVPITPGTEKMRGGTYEVVHPTARIRACAGRMPLALEKHGVVFEEKGRKWVYTIPGKAEKWYFPPWLGGKWKAGVTVEIGEYDGGQGRKDGMGWTSVEKVGWGSEEDWVRVVGEGRRWEWVCRCLGVAEGGSACVCGRWEMERRRREEQGRRNGGEVHVDVRTRGDELEAEVVHNVTEG